jgi:hypothetical protein
MISANADAESRTMKLEKDDAEHPIPEHWRSRFRQIADAFVAGDYQLRHHSIKGVAPIDPDTAQHIARNIAAYGDALAPLNDETWDWSVYIWMDDYWQVLVDLSTTRQKVSDLSLHARFCRPDGLRLEIDSVHVP